MLKTWLYQRKNRKGWWVGWYADGKRRCKCLPNKALARQFAQRKEHQLNEDIYPDPISTRWGELTAEHLKHKETIEGRAEDTLRIIRNTLRFFKLANGPLVSTQLSQRHIDAFIAYRLKSVVKSTVNKELRSLKAFVNWAIQYRYMGRVADRIQWTMQKVPKRHPRALTATQRRNLCIAAKNHKYSYYCRVLLAMVTGLRVRDIERLGISDIDFESSTIRTFSRKTGKTMTDRWVHPKVLDELAKYIHTLPDRQDKLFLDSFTHKQWKKVRSQAGLPTLKFHDLRKTFGSVLAQKGVGQSVVQNLLEHSDPKLTHEIYTDIDPVIRALCLISRKVAGARFRKTAASSSGSHRFSVALIVSPIFVTSQSKLVKEQFTRVPYLCQIRRLEPQGRRHR